MLAVVALLIGYEAVMREAGLEPRLVIDRTFAPEAGVGAMQTLLAEGDTESDIVRCPSSRLLSAAAVSS